MIRRTALWPLVCLIAVLCPALNGQVTSMGLYKPPRNTTNWDVLLNANSDLINQWVSGAVPFPAGVSTKLVDPPGSCTTESYLYVSLATPSTPSTWACNGTHWVNTGLAASASAALKANNLSDLANAASARTNLGLGTSAVLASAAVAQTANNLSDLGSISSARTNLGLGTAATQASSSFDTAGAAAAAQAASDPAGSATTVQGLSLQKGSNLSDVSSASTARTNLGLGTSSTLSAAALAQTANNLSDLASPSTARTNLGLGTASTLAAAAIAQTANNLSDLANTTTARGNLGLGSAALLASSAVAQAANNLSDLASASTARTNLGLGTSATMASGAFIADPASNGIPYRTAAGAARVAAPDADFQSAIVINPIASYGCVPDGSTDNTSCLMTMNAALLAKQAADTSNSIAFRIQPPAGQPCHFTYTNNRWTWGLKRIFLDMPGCTIQNVISDSASTASAEKYPLLTGGGAFYEASATCFTPSCNINGSVDAGDLINTANPGDTTLTLVTSAANTKYSIGDWVLIYSYNQSPVVPGVFPPHARYVDWAKVTAVNNGTGVLTLDRSVTYLHASTYPEDPNYLTQNQSPTGMARVINLRNPVSNIGPTERFYMNGVKVLTNPNTSLTSAQQFFWLNNVINAYVSNCDFPSFIPEIAMSVIAVNNKIDYTEPDQLVGYLEIDGGYIGSNASAQGVANMKLSGGTYASSIQFNPRVLKVDSVIANGATQVAGSTGFAFNFAFNNAPSRVSIQSSLLNGKNFYTDQYIGQPSQPSITLGGAQGAVLSGNSTVTAPFSVAVTGTLTSGSPNITGVTNAANIASATDAITGTGIASGSVVSNASGTTIVMNKNATASGSQSLTVFMNPNWKFWACIEQGGVVLASAATPDGVPRAGTVSNIYGGTTALTADFKFSGTIPANATLTCDTTPSLSMMGNKYNNWTLELDNQTNAVPPYPSVPSLNIEDIVQNNGRLHSYRFDTAYAGSGQVLNVNGVIRRIVVEVTQPYAGSDTTATMRFAVGAGVPASSETVNLAIPGRREIYSGETNNAQSGDSLVPLGYYYADSVNIVQINQSGQNALAGTAAQQALYTVTLETESPYRSNIQ